MSSFVKRWLKDDAVLWSAAQTFSDQGRMQVNSAIEIRCRWEEKTGEIINERGETIGFSDVLLVKQDIEEGSIMWRGKISDLPSNLSELTGLRQVIKFAKIGDIKGRVFYRRVMLMKYHDTLPTIV